MLGASQIDMAREENGARSRKPACASVLREEWNSKVRWKGFCDNHHFLLTSMSLLHCTVLAEKLKYRHRWSFSLHS